MAIRIAADATAHRPAELMMREDLMVARLISDALCPPVIATISIIIAAAHLATPSAWEAAALFLAIAIAVPTLYVFWLLSRGEVTDFHLRVREERIKPMIVIVIMTLGAWFMLIIRQAPALLLGMTTVGMAITMVLLLITLRWKISAHTTAISGLVVLCWWLAGAVTAPMALCIPLVAWARVRLQRHTLAQTVAGAALGLAASLAFCVFH